VIADAAAVIQAVRPLLRAYCGGLDGALRERVMVAVSQTNSCRGCTQAHRRWALREGVTPRELEAIGAGDLAGLDARNRAAIVYAGELAEHRFAAPCPDIAAAAAAHLTVSELEQITGVARATALANLSLNELLGRRATSRGRVSAHPLFARVWSLVAPRVAPDAQRAELLAGLTGHVVELGCGEGRNFRHYPPQVRHVTAVEPEPYLRQLAASAARDTPVDVTVVAGDADALPAEAGSCDAVVASLVLCSVPDQAAALAEIVRVLRPGGELRFFEHVVARQPLAAALQRGLDDSGIWPRLGGGCHLARDTATAIAASGLVIEHLRRVPLGPRPVHVPAVVGIARRGQGASPEHPSDR
jgi:AhpD family alkylhydroperoxidase